MKDTQMKDSLRSEAFEKFSPPTAILDGDGRILDCNPAWSELFPGDGPSRLDFVNPSLPVVALLAKARQDGRAELMLPINLSRRQTLRLQVTHLSDGHFRASTGEPEDQTGAERLQASFDSRPEGADHGNHLPGRPAALPAAIAPGTAPKPAAEPEPGPLVLVAEDHPLNLEMTMELLRRHGFRVEGAEDGLKCLVRARETHPDLVLMDLAMPGMDGFEALRNFRADPDLDLRRARVIALTAYAMPEDRERVLRAGFNGYLAKPFAAVELIALIEQELGRGRS